MYKIPANTLFIGQSLVFMPECHSTNDEALQLLKAGKGMEGTLVVTDSQLAGRGQRSNTWESENGMNLTFSVLLTPHFLPVRDQFYLTMCISLAIADYLHDTLQGNIKIKWPNDVLIDDKKVCGILIENQVGGHQIQSSVVGIGLNVNQHSFSIPKAVSMKQVSGQTYDLNHTLNKVLEKIESRYLMLKQGKWKELSSDYLKCLYWLGETRTFSIPQKEFQGKIIGIDEVGRLLMEQEEGVTVFGIKEVQFIR